jgi:hypothetical protein
MRYKRKDAEIIMGNSLLRMGCSTLRGEISADNPRINPMLAILLPIILPKAILSVFLIIATKLTHASGDEVPKATTVSPMIIGLIPKNLAILDEPRTSPSPPRYKSIKPKKNKNILRVCT